MRTRDVSKTLNPPPPFLTYENRLDICSFTSWPEYQEGSSIYHGLSSFAKFEAFLAKRSLVTFVTQGMSAYKIWNVLVKTFFSYPLHKVWKTNMTFDLDLWHTDMNISKDHPLMKDHLPTKFEASMAITQT